METLDLPVIEPAMAAAPAAPRTEVAVAAAAALDLTKIDLKDVALAQFGDWRKASGEVAKKVTGLVLDLSTQTKIDNAISLRQRLCNVPRAEARRVSKELKSKLASVSKAIGAEEALVIEAYDAAEKPLSEQIDAAQKKLDDEKEAKRIAEETRLADLRATVDLVMAKWLNRAQAEGMTSERIGAGIAALQAVAMPEELADVTAHWTTAKATTVSAMERLQLEAARREEQARLEAQRIENERIAAEQRAQAEALAEAQRKLAEQAAEIERQRKEMEAAQARAAALPAADAGTGAEPDSSAGEGGEPRAEREAAPLVLLPKPATSPKSHPTHGFSQTAEYRAWQAMVKRCTDPENAAWADYGGRGITVCERWRNSVAAFIEDMGAKPTEFHELDRENNDKGYEPDNCRWVLRDINNRNRRSNRIVEWRGQQKTLVEWCEITGLAFTTLKWRLDNGWSVDRAMTEGVGPDATDRGQPAIASPVGGPMGAGQPAAAGPAEGDLKNTPQEGANRDASTGQRHDAAGSESPAGRGTNGASALGAAPAFLPEERSIETSEDDAVPLSMEQVKAITAPRVIVAEQVYELDHADLLREALELTRYAAAAFDSKFPSQPKPGPDWWKGLRERVESLQPLLSQALQEV